MKLISFLIICVVLVVSCKQDKINGVNLPKLKAAPYDTIIQINVDEMQPIDLYVQNINFKTYTDFSQDRELTEKDYEFSYKKKPLTDSIIVIVDAKLNSDFHSPQITSQERLPSPPPPPSEANNFYNSDSIFKVYGDKHKAFINKRKRKHYNTLPLLIYNNANTKRLVEHNSLNGELFAITEAKSTTGEWQPIEYIAYYKSCGNGKLFKLQPKQFMVTTIPKYSGDFETDLRVRFYSFGKIYYSNTFKGSINQSQFNKSKVLERLNFRYGRNIEQYNAKLKFVFLDY